jgi:hypothetical protein
MEKLLRLAESEKIDIIYLPLKKDLWGLYIPGRPGNNPKIYLDIDLKDNLKFYRLTRCILAEELGHHFTGTWSVFKIHTSYSLKRKMSSDDEKALRWATNKLIPTKELIALLKEGIWEGINLADYFGVTPWLMYRKMEFLQYHIKAKRKEACLTLSPALIAKVKISCIY